MIYVKNTRLPSPQCLGVELRMEEDGDVSLIYNGIRVAYISNYPLSFGELRTVALSELECAALAHAEIKYDINVDMIQICGYPSIKE